MNPSLFDLYKPYDISDQDFVLAQTYIPALRSCDLVIAPDGEPYLFRWHLVPRNRLANIYFHIQVKSDPERPMHDHPWDNASVILVGRYDEEFSGYGRIEEDFATLHRQTGDFIYRNAEDAHRLILPADVPYTMTLFLTGPHRREWGFWYPEGWVSNKEVCKAIEGVSVHGSL